MSTLTLYVPHFKNEEQTLHALAPDIPELRGPYMFNMPGVPFTCRKLMVFTWRTPFPQRYWNTLQLAVKAGTIIRAEFEGIMGQNEEYRKYVIGRSLLLSLY